MKSIIFVLVVLVILALVGKYQCRQYDFQYRDLVSGREVVSTTVESLEGIDVVMDRSLGKDKDRYSIDVKREAFEKLNPDIDEMLQPGQPVWVPGPIKKTEMAQN